MKVTVHRTTRKVSRKEEWSQRKNGVMCEVHFPKKESKQKKAKEEEEKNTIYDVSIPGPYDCMHILYAPRM